MAGGRSALPARVHLPSGRIVLLSDRAARASNADSGDDSSRPCLRDLAVLGSQGVVRDAAGGESEVLDFELRDLHVLRALLAYAGVIGEPEGQYSCANCDA